MLGRPVVGPAPWVRVVGGLLLAGGLAALYAARAGVIGRYGLFAAIVGLSIGGLLQRFGPRAAVGPEDPGPHPFDPFAGTATAPDAPRLPAAHRYGISGAVLAFVGALCMLVFRGIPEPADMVVLVYGGLLVLVGAILLAVAWVARARDGPAPAGPFLTPADRPSGRVVVADVSGAWAAVLVSGGAIALVLGIAALGLGPAWTAWTAIAAGVVLAGAGLRLTWRDAGKQGHRAGPLMLMGFGAAAAAYGGLYLVLLRGLDGPRSAQWMTLALFCVGALVFTLGFRARDPDATPPLKRSGAFWAGFMLVLPLVGLGFVGANGVFLGGVADHLDCFGRSSEQPLGSANVTVAFVAPPSDGPQLPEVPFIDPGLFAEPDAAGTAPFAAPAATSVIRIGAMDGLRFEVEVQDNGTWVPAGGGAEDEAGDHAWGRGPWPSTSMRVLAWAPNDRDGTAQDVEVRFTRDVTSC